MMRRLGQHHRDDSGVTVVVVALCLTLLMVMAAFAMDIGAMYSERRLDQNAADAAATSAAVVLLVKNDNTLLQEAVTEAVQRVNGGLSRTVSTAAWQACTDPGKLTVTAKSRGLSPATDCISFDRGLLNIRVRVPDQQTDTTFARVIGVNTLSTNAFAQTSLEVEGGDALPFLALSTVTGGDQICLRTGDNGTAQPPPPLTGGGPGVPFRALTPADDKPGTEIREDLDPCDAANYLVAAASKGTIIPRDYRGDCNPNGNKSVVDAIIAGLDHLVGIFESPAFSYPNPPGDSTVAESTRQGTYGDVRVDGGGSCTVVKPNTFPIDTGVSNYLPCALLGPDVDVCADNEAGEGRLRRGSYVQGSVTFARAEFDNKPIWDFLVPSLPNSAPASCRSLQANLTNPSWDYYDKRDALSDCLRSWSNGDPVLFTDQIKKTTRFAYVPQVAEKSICKDQALYDCPPGPPAPNVHFNSFVPVYLDRLYQEAGDKCAVGDPRDTNWAMHTPGEPMAASNCGKKNLDVSRISGQVVPCGSLPPELCDPSSNPPVAGLGTTQLFKVRLTK